MAIALYSPFGVQLLMCMVQPTKKLLGGLRTSHDASSSGMHELHSSMCSPVLFDFKLVFVHSIKWPFSASPTKAIKDIVVFRFIIEYSSLRDFGP